jgi:hypothetical protein
MALKNFTLALVLTGLAVGVYANRRRAGSWTRSGQRNFLGRTASTPSADTAFPMGSQRVSPEGTTRSSDSGWAAGSEGSDVFSSSSQQSEKPAGAGLPDFTRGA